jgi:hypothetical protein
VFKNISFKRITKLPREDAVCMRPFALNERIQSLTSGIGLLRLFRKEGVKMYTDAALIYLKSSVFWDITPCGSACYLLFASFLLGLFFDPEDGGDIFLRNVW